MKMLMVCMLARARVCVCTTTVGDATYAKDLDDAPRMMLHAMELVVPIDTSAPEVKRHTDIALFCVFLVAASDGLLG